MSLSDRSNIEIFSSRAFFEICSAANVSGDTKTPFFSRVAIKSARSVCTSFCNSRTSLILVTRRFTSGLHRTLLALEAYSAVATVSSTLDKLGPTVAKIHVLLFPPSASRNKRVSFESRYGTCASLSTSAVTTLPRVKSDLLISPASRDRAVAPRSATPLLPTFSEPARSTKFNLPILIRSSPSSSTLGERVVTETENTEWLREECLLHSVAAFLRLPLPVFANSKASATFFTVTSVRPSTATPPRPSSIRRCERFPPESPTPSPADRSSPSSDNKSVISSLYSSRNVHFTAYSVVVFARWRNI